MNQINILTKWKYNELFKIKQFKLNPTSLNQIRLIKLQEKSVSLFLFKFRIKDNFTSNNVLMRNNIYSTYVCYFHGSMEIAHSKFIFLFGLWDLSLLSLAINNVPCQQTGFSTEWFLYGHLQLRSQQFYLSLSPDSRLFFIFISPSLQQLYDHFVSRFWLVIS